MIQSELTGPVDRATIYLVLNKCCENGIVHRIVEDNGKQYFALCLNSQKKHHQHNHFHFRCLNCGNIECLEQEREIPLPEGYQQKHLNGMITSYCQNCSEQSE